MNNDPFDLILGLIFNIIKIIVLLWLSFELLFG